MIYSDFTGQSFETLAAVNEARSNQLAAESIRLGLPPEPVDPDAAARAEIAHLTRMGGAGANVAAAILHNAALPVLPLDRDAMQPSTAEPFTTVQQVADHWRTHLADGVAVPTGTLPSGGALLALRGTPKALREWMAEHATESIRKLEEERVIFEGRSARDVGDYTSVRWFPPAGRGGIKATTLGIAALERATGELLFGATQETEQRPSWLVWSVAAVWHVPPVTDTDSAVPTRRRLEVKSRKLDAAVELVGAGGYVPQYIARPDGWRLEATAMPTAVRTEQVPDWLLVDAFGGRWVDEVLVDDAWKPAAKVRAA